MDDSKYDSNWWFGENSMWSQSGLKEAVTGVKQKASNKWTDNLEVPVKVNLGNETQLVIVGVIGLILLKQFKIL